MAAENREKTESIIERLRQAPWEFEFFPAMRRLEHVCEGGFLAGESIKPSEEDLRLGQEPHLSFSPASISRFQPRGGDNGYHRLSVKFFGLLGPNGPLPLRISEYVQNRIQHHGDVTLARFFDMFHHRMLTFFYSAWARNQKAVEYEGDGESRFDRFIGSFAGYGQPLMRDRDALPDEAKFSYAGLMASSTSAPSGLEQCIADYFDVPVELEEFVGEWMVVPRNERCQLGSTNANLGKGAMMGERVWNCQYKFRLKIGPLDMDEFRTLLPGGLGLKEMRAMVHNYVGMELKCELNLLVKAREVPKTRLGQQGRLGWSTWLRENVLTEDADQVRLDLLSCGKRN